MGLALGLVGCGSARKPQLIILPSYSYVRAGVDLEAIISPPQASVAREVEFLRADGRSRSTGGKPQPGM